MSAEPHHDPGPPAVRIDLTPRASRQVRALVADRSRADARRERTYALRVAPAPDGQDASDGEEGQAYRLSLSPGAGPEDVVLPRNGFEVLLDRAHAEALDGLRIDFVDSGDDSGFVLDRVHRPRPRGTPRELPWTGTGADPAAPAPAAGPGVDRTGPLWARVQAALDLVRPGLRHDGGDVELVEVEAGAAAIRLTGACAGCSLSAMTLTTLVEATVTAEVPEIDRIVPVG